MGEVKSNESYEVKGVALNLKQSFEKWVYFGWLVDSIDPDADHGIRVLMTSAYLHPGVEDSIELDNDGWTTRQVIRSSWEIDRNGSTRVCRPI